MDQESMRSVRDFPGWASAFVPFGASTLLVVLQERRPFRNKPMPLTVDRNRWRKTTQF